VSQCGRRPCACQFNVPAITEVQATQAFTGLPPDFFGKLPGFVRDCNVPEYTNVTLDFRGVQWSQKKLQIGTRVLVPGR
jgi:hypothetical protein